MNKSYINDIGINPYRFWNITNQSSNLKVTIVIFVTLRFTKLVIFPKYASLVIGFKYIHGINHVVLE